MVLLLTKNMLKFCEKKKAIEDEIARVMKINLGPTPEVNSLLESYGSTSFKQWY